MTDTQEIQFVKNLRSKTSVSLKDCIEVARLSKYNTEEALKLLKVRGKKILEKKSSRATNQGTIAISTKLNSATIVALKTETDFASRQEQFRTCSKQIADKLHDGYDRSSIDPIISDMVLSLRENIQLGDYGQLSGPLVNGYVHDHRIGAIVALDGGDVDLAYNLAVHIVATQPRVIQINELSADDIAREKAIYKETFKDKPVDIVDKIISSKLESFYKEKVLLKQSYILDDNKTVEEVLGTVKVIGFKIVQL